MVTYCNTKQNAGHTVNHMTHTEQSAWKCFCLFSDKTLAAELQRQANSYMSGRMWHYAALHAILFSNKTQHLQLQTIQLSHVTLQFCILSRFCCNLYLIPTFDCAGCCYRPPFHYNQVHPLCLGGVIHYSAIKMMTFKLNHNWTSGTEPWEVQVTGHVINHRAGKSIRHLFDFSTNPAVSVLNEFQVWTLSSPHLMLSHSHEVLFAPSPGF